MTNKSFEKEANVITINEEDRVFIRDLMALPVEGKNIIKGILIGIELQNVPMADASAVEKKDLCTKQFQQLSIKEMVM